MTLQVSLECEDERLATILFAIKDTGIGIPADKLGDLFHAFTQVDASTTRRFGGTGLGLTISKQLVELMGGQIGVESEEGQGSTFRFTARLEKQAPGEDVDTRRIGDPQVLHERIITRHTIADDRKRRIRILVAEDSVINQKVALKILERMGYRADAVANGLEAVRALETIPYDLVLMDVQMPEMDGLEATRKIRSWKLQAGSPGDQDSRCMSRAARMPIVALTAHVMKGVRERCLEAGMDDYISKPIRPGELAAAIARWIPTVDCDRQVKSSGHAITDGVPIADRRRRHQE